jgi:hypothetical protein
MSVGMGLETRVHCLNGVICQTRVVSFPCRACSQLQALSSSHFSLYSSQSNSCCLAKKAACLRSSILRARNYSSIMFSSTILRRKHFTQHLSLCQSIPCNHTMEAQAAKQYKTNVTQLINQKVFYMRPHNIITYFTHSYLCIVRFRIICKIITHPESLLQSLVAS